MGFEADVLKDRMPFLSPNQQRQNTDSQLRTCLAFLNIILYLLVCRLTCIRAVFFVVTLNNSSH